MIKLATTIISIIIFLGEPSTSPLYAHSLGIDPAELTEQTNGTYTLVSKVPRSLASYISSPVLPEHCTFLGDQRGQRGFREVRFTFACDKPLTANDFLILPWQREGVLLTTTWADGTSSKNLVKREGGEITIDLKLFLADSGSLFAASKRYLSLGIEHILLGIDHLLFVLALLLMVSGSWLLVKTITAFTAAHSITLALATLGFIKVPSGPVEAVIALSIVFVCTEIVHARQGRIGLTYQHPWIVAFAFGLLHGLGFAGALAEIGLPPNEIPLALLFFNVGVEIGQLLFVFVVFITIKFWNWSWRSLGPEKWGWARAVPVYVIGTVSTYWFIERTISIFPTIQY